jgi:hypothetical protein
MSNFDVSDLEEVWNSAGRLQQTLPGLTKPSHEARVLSGSRAVDSVGLSLVWMRGVSGNAEPESLLR